MASTGEISDAFSVWAYFCFVKTAFLVIFVLKSELLPAATRALTQILFYAYICFRYEKHGAFSGFSA
jgi:hypothetical protein